MFLNNSTVSFLVLQVVLVAFGVSAWTSVPAATNRRHFHSNVRSRIFAIRPSSDSGDIHDIANGQSCYHESSRRQWLSGAMAAAATGTLATWANPPPAFAAVPTSAALCDPTVSAWERNGRFIYLLGTAHISKSSADLAGQLVRDTHPDAVFVELDLKRIGYTGNKPIPGQTQSLTISNRDNPDAPPTRIVIPGVTPPSTMLASSSTPPSSSETPQSTAAVAAAQPPAQQAAAAPVAAKPQGGLLSNLGGAAVGKGIKSMYGKLGSEGFSPGEEFVVAVKEGQKLGAAVVLGDQDVDITLTRLAEAIRKTDLGKLISPNSELEEGMRALLPESTPPPGVAPDQMARDDLTQFVETIKTKENVKKIMGLLEREAPAIHRVMVSERDAYMAAGLNTLNEFSVITAVMGLAHVDGVEKNLSMNGWKPVALKCPTVA